MSHPETGPTGGPTRNDIIKRIKEWFERLLAKKKIQEEAEGLEKERRAAETGQKRREAEDRRKEEDKEKEFYQRGSDQDRIDTTDALRRTKREEIKARLENFVHDQGKEGSVYLLEFIRDETAVANLKTLIDQSSAAAYLIEEFVTGGRELHSDAARLINLGRDLLAAAASAPGGKEAAQPLLSAVEKQVNNLMDDTIREYARQLRAHSIEPSHWPQWFNEKIKHPLENGQKLTDEQKTNLLRAVGEKNPKPAEPIISSFFTEPIKKSPADTEDTSWVNVGEPEHEEGMPHPPKKMVEEVDKIWQKVQLAEETGAHLTTEQLEEAYRDILKAESNSLPPDLISGSKTFHKAIRSAHRLAESRLDVLADKLKRRLMTEKPRVKRGITNPEEFLKEMGLVRQGYLAVLLEENPEMMRLLVGKVAGKVSPEKIEESVRFRNQVFLTIHKRILTDPHSSSGENFGLYERADLTTFLNILGTEMAHLVNPNTGATFGDTWVSWYTNLSSAIRLSRDIDFYASTPGVAIDDWARSFSLFKNEISSQAMLIPAVEQAYRALETTLRSIRDSNDGYIPPGLIEYDPVYGTSHWNSLAQQIFMNMIKTGQVYEMEKDEVTGFHLADPSGRTAVIGKKLNFDKLMEKDPQRLELSMYMTLAKGFGLSSVRFLEMFTNSKIPGSRHPEFGMAGKHFHSTPYEGPARAMNYINTVIHKWSFGSYKYLQIMNTLLPEGHKIPAMDSEQAKAAYRAYMDGTFEDEFGPEAKRMFDKLNFSRMTSAFSSNYTWRQMDSTIGWSDKQRELLGGPIRLIFAEKWAKAKVREYLVESKYKEEYRRKLQAAGQPTAGWEFDAMWKNRALPALEYKITEEWEKLSKEKWVKEMIENYQKALSARALIETTARNPLAMAHAIDVKITDSLTGLKRKVKLHNLIAHQVLGIPPEYTKYGDMLSQAAEYAKPTAEQLQYIKEIIGLESDIAAVREIAINGTRHDNGDLKDPGNRELKVEDFSIIADDVRRDQAIKYWRLVQEAVFGTTSPDHLYEELGMKVGENRQDYDLDWGKIKKAKEEVVDVIAKHKISLSDGTVINSQLEDLLEKDWKEEIIIGTDSTAFRQMDLLNLGGRQWVRLAGDAASHYHGGERVGKYLTTDLNTNPDPGNLAKALLEVRQMYEGDNIDMGWRVVSYLANATGKLYGMDYKRFGSPAQLDVWQTRRGVAAWTANARRKFIDALEHLDVLPPTAEAWGYDIPKGTDLHHLRKFLRADNVDVWVEILTLGIMLAFIITIWRALTAKSEEEEEGGGGGGHGH
ncbi:hypothetical protein FJY90_02620 [Candidatus Gottesmanbacteria bacterium]|nr:hypothetical protein [Candidatus Gottesmanbacteria bacterium]